MKVIISCLLRTLRNRACPAGKEKIAKESKEKLELSGPWKPFWQAHRKLYDEGVYAEKVWQNEVDDVLLRLPHPSTMSGST